VVLGIIVIFLAKKFDISYESVQLLLKSVSDTNQ